MTATANGESNGTNGVNGHGISNGISTRSKIDAKDLIITSFEIHDLRFPTSLDASGSDAMNPAGDYSAAYLILHTHDSSPSPSSNSNSALLLRGHGFAFTIGRGNDLVCLAASYIASRLVGKSLAELTSNMGATWRDLVSDSQLRWIGPEKGVIHLGLSATVNALWDLWARWEGKPVWKLVCDMSPEEVVRCVDWRYITDALTPDAALEMLRETAAVGREGRLRDVQANTAVPAYSTQAGWLGFSDERMVELMKGMMESGFDKFKLKVGGSVEDDVRRMRIARSVVGGESMLMVDANQVWDVKEAVEWMKKLVEFKPAFIEEPTSPDDILGHAAIRKALKPYGVGVATGEHCQNRVIFKQLLQAEAIDVCQIDACRLGGVNEVLAVLLLAKKFNTPVIPHSGGIGLNELTNHLQIINYVVISGKKSLLEHINSFHEVLTTPVQVKNGHFVAPWEPGYSVEYTKEAILKYEYPKGEFWNSAEGLKIQNGPKR